VTTSRRDALDAVVALVRADAELRRRLDSQLSGVHGLSLNDLVILTGLHEAPAGRLRRIDLAARLGVTASAVTRLLVPLEKVGLVHRESDPRDARSAMATLTPAGTERARDAEVTATAIAQQLLGDRLSTAEVATLSRLLRKLAPF
jgi:DNA-binding MarR family transcriptional regulator